MDVPILYRSTFAVAGDPVLDYIEEKADASIGKVAPTPTKAGTAAKTSSSVRPAAKPASSTAYQQKLTTSETIAFVKIDSQQEPSIRQSLQMCYPELLVDCPDLANAVRYVIEKVFPGDITGQYIVTNNTYTTPSGHLMENVSVRSISSSFLKNHLFEEDLQLRISGLITGNGIFDISRIDVVRQSPLTFNERKYSFKFKYDFSQARDNILQQIAQDIPTYSKEMQDELALWSEYLDWKQKLVELKIRSVKYIAVRVIRQNDIPTGFSFLCVSPDKDSFNRFTSALRRESEQLAVFSNSVSKDRWNFVYNSELNTRIEREISMPFSGVLTQVADTYEWDDLGGELRSSGETLSTQECRAKVSMMKGVYPDPIYFETVFDIPFEDAEYIDGQSLVGDEAFNYLKRRIIQA